MRLIISKVVAKENEKDFKVPSCHNQSVLQFRSFKPNVILSLCQCPLQETKQTRLPLANLITNTQRSERGDSELWTGCHVSLRPLK